MAEKLSCDVLVVGAGPAGLAAAVAASGDASVTLVDESPWAGGQIWRGMEEARSSPSRRFLVELFRANVRILSSTCVFDLPESCQASTHGPEGARRIEFQKLVLATGARELFLPFQGWTLPGVYGTGGLQALVKQGFDVRGKRVVVAGSGPLLLAAAKGLRQKGAKVVGLFEQAPPRNVREFGLALWQHPSKLKQVFGFLPETRRLKPGWWVERATGANRLQAVVATNGAVKREFQCDLLASAFGLVPNNELASLAGCRLRNGFVEVDKFQRTSEERIFAAGEIVEIGGAEAAILQGSIAGFAAVGRERGARMYFPARQRTSFFSESLARAFELREEVKCLANDDTIVCRCEDVRYGQIKSCRRFQEAKLHTRLGMGPCQGRVCGAACRALFGWEAPSVRPPLCPVPVEGLAIQEAAE